MLLFTHSRSHALTQGVAFVIYRPGQPTTQGAPMANDLTIEANLGALSVCMTAEGQSWNPDVAEDMQGRIVKAMASLIALCKREEVLHLIPAFDADDLPDIDEDGADE